MDPSSVVQLWPPAWSLILTPLILAVSAATAFRLLLLNIKSNAEKRKLDTILKIIGDEQADGYSKLNAAFVRTKHENLFDRIKNPDIEEMRALRGDVLRYLNHYEIVAISLRQGLLDIEIYKSWMAASLVRDWNTAFDFVVTLRWTKDKNGNWRYYKEIYENFEWLAGEFSSEAQNAPLGSNEALQRKPT